MPKRCYVPKNFGPESMKIIATANEIVETYAAQGYDLTLRQLYYQFVSRALIANKDTEYKRLGSIINDARLAGLVDWNAITDRTRNLQKNSHWTSPRDILKSAASSFALDAWAGQDCRPEVWIEKDALVGVITGVCQELDVPYFSCRGYTSQSEMWSAAMRLRGYPHKNTVVIHLGDHDPSGKDMTRDIRDRLSLFMGEEMHVERIALTMDQIDAYNPPPNPAKITDSRATVYIAEFGDESWELDALEPQVLSDLVRETILAYRDDDAYAAVMDREREHKDRLLAVGQNWAEVAQFLEGIGA